MKKYLQINLFAVFGVPFQRTVQGFSGRSVDASELEVPRQSDRIQGTVRLPLEGLHVAVEINSDAVPG